MKNGIDRKKVSCEEKAKQLAEIGTVCELRVLFMRFLQPVRPVSDSIQDTGRSQNFVCWNNSPEIKTKDMACWACCQYAGNAVSM